MSELSFGNFVLEWCASGVPGCGTLAGGGAVDADALCRAAQESPRLVDFLRHEVVLPWVTDVSDGGAAGRSSSGGPPRLFVLPELFAPLVEALRGL